MASYSEVCCDANLYMVFFEWDSSSLEKVYESFSNVGNWIVDNAARIYGHAFDGKITISARFDMSNRMRLDIARSRYDDFSDVEMDEEWCLKYAQEELDQIKQCGKYLIEHVANIVGDFPGEALSTLTLEFSFDDCYPVVMLDVHREHIVSCPLALDTEPPRSETEM